ncbi:hypothetical protein J4417_02775 [Candidatus Woesearchaeota archaeon]|nr:hypothetical protein [Candidatus Woesearchaeota archaeon]
MPLFKKGGAGRNPVDEVQQLRSQGLEDNEIISELQMKGYDFQTINNALSQAGMGSPMPAGPEMNEELAPPPGFPSSESYGPMPAAAPPREMLMMETSSAPNEEAMYEKMEEIVEGVIDEKWNELLGEVKKIISWKEKTEAAINEMREEVSRVQEDFKTLHQGVLGKVEEYDATMRDVGTELRAVGQVFKDVIPEFTENVKELSETTKKLKQKK